MHLSSLMLSAFALALVAGCSRSEPPATPLAREPDVPYRTIITTYHEDDSAWQPFKVEVERDQGRGDRRQVFFAEQCEDVSVAQTRKLLYVFYDQMYLNQLRAKSSYLDEPKPFLCDLGVPFCLAERERLRRSGTKIIKVCPSRNADGTPGR